MLPPDLPTIAPALAVPADAKASKVWWIYDDYPSPSGWPAYFEKRVLSGAHTPQSWSDLLAKQVGAPLGSFSAQSYRVARSTGLLVAPASRKSASPQLLGLGISHALAYAQFSAVTELTVTIEAPLVVTCGEKVSTHGQEFLKARCLWQLKAQVPSMLERIAGVTSQTTFRYEFLGEWPGDTEGIQQGLISAARNVFVAKKPYRAP